MARNVTQEFSCDCVASANASLLTNNPGDSFPRTGTRQPGSHDAEQVELLRIADAAAADAAAADDVAGHLQFASEQNRTACLHESITPPRCEFST